MKLLRLKQVKELTTLSQATIYRLAAKGAFPKWVIIGDRAYPRQKQLKSISKS